MVFLWKYYSFVKTRGFSPYIFAYSVFLSTYLYYNFNLSVSLSSYIKFRAKFRADDSVVENKSVTWWSFTMGFGLDQLDFDFFSPRHLSAKEETDELDESQPFPSRRIIVRPSDFFSSRIVVRHRDFDKAPTRASNETEQTTETALSWPLGTIEFHEQDEEDVAEKQLWRKRDSTIHWSIWAAGCRKETPFIRLIYFNFVAYICIIFDLLEGGCSLISNDFRVLVPGNHGIHVYLDTNTSASLSLSLSFSLYLHVFVWYSPIT